MGKIMPQDHQDKPSNINDDSANHAQTNSNATHAQVNQEPEQRPKAIKFILVIALLIVLALIIFGLWKAYQPKNIELQGRVEAETLHMSTKLPSRIEKIFVHDGEKVKQGQLLATLSSPEIDAKKQQALASLQSALALQSSTERGSQQENIDSLYANWQALKAQESLAATTYQRGENLFREGVISQQRRDQLHTAAISSAQMTESAYQQYSRAKRGSTPQQQSSADAQVAIAQAAVAEANALEAETQLIAPTPGTISKIYGKPSELVAIGVPVISIIQEQDLHISLNVREDLYAQVYQLKQIDGFIPALNQKATFKIQHIEAEGEFATIKTTRQTGGYDVRSFKISLVPTQALPDLKVGMSVLFQFKESS